MVLETIRAGFALSSDCEISLEANPGTVDGEYLAGLRALGVNRLSLGVQSADPRELALLDRLHSFEQAAEAVRQARQAGFENVNLDLIFGIMFQSIESWRRTLEAALSLEPEHLSLYALTLESGTPMQARVLRGELPTPDGDLAADMYEHAAAGPGRGGLPALRDLELGQGWGGAACLPAQPAILAQSAVPRVRRRRPRQCPRVALRQRPFATRVHRRLSSGEPQPAPFSPAVAEQTPVDPPTDERDTLLLGLRLIEEGVEMSVFQRRYGGSLMDVFEPDVRELQELGLLDVLPDRIRTYTRGHLLANQVFVHFV